jgi:integrase
VIEKRMLSGGRKQYRVRWRDGGRGSKERVKVFDRHEDAVRFETDIRRRKQLGELALFEQSKVTLDEFAREWWKRYASTELARKTQERYASIWDLHVLPRLGGLQLRQLTPGLVAEFQSELRAAGVGEPTIRKTLSLLQAVCRDAVTWGRLGSNPVKPVRKRAAVRGRMVQPLAPEAVERLRRQMPSDRDAALVSVLAYAGLRPGEALALTWGHVRERTILVERAVSYGELKSTKTRATRSVRILAPLKLELAELRLRNGRPDDRALVFPAQNGRPWDDDDWKNWRRRAFATAAKQAGLTDVRPHDLRHSFVSLLIAEGRSIVDVARQAGHSATMALDTYGHVFDELDGAEKIVPEQAIFEARNVRCDLGATQKRRRGEIVASESNVIPLFAGASE